MSKILIKLPRTVVDEETGRKILLGKFEKHYIADLSKQFSDKKHTFDKAELEKEPHRFSLGKENYITLDADYLDEYKQLNRLAQIITLKDIGRILTLLGLNRESVFVEAGSGSGAVTKYFAGLVKEVHSYEINDEHLAIARENCVGLDNVQFYHKGVEEVAEHSADGFLLDVPDPAAVIEKVISAVRIGGRVVVYTPNLTQAQEVVRKLPENVLYEGTSQLTETDWVIKDKVLRPRMQGLGHTAFLTVLRKLPK